MPKESSNYRKIDQRVMQALQGPGIVTASDIKRFYIEESLPEVSSSNYVSTQFNSRRSTNNVPFTERTQTPLASVSVSSRGQGFGGRTIIYYDPTRIGENTARERYLQRKRLEEQSEPKVEKQEVTYRVLEDRER